MHQLILNKYLSNLFLTMSYLMILKMFQYLFIKLKHNGFQYINNQIISDQIWMN